MTSSMETCFLMRDARYTHITFGTSFGAMLFRFADDIFF